MTTGLNLPGGRLLEKKVRGGKGGVWAQDVALGKRGVIRKGQRKFPRLTRQKS